MRIGSAGRPGWAWLAAVAGGLVTSAAFAAGIGQPEPWQMDAQQQVTEVGHDVYAFHHWINWMMVVITLFVLGLIITLIVRFNERKNPEPSRTTHHTLLEVAWTIVPVLILVAIAIPSFRILRKQLADPKADIVVKVIGHAWYWEYEYPADQGGFKFDANLVEEKDLQPGMLRLLATDNEMVVPVNKIVKVQVTAADVLHSWGVPSLGFTVDAIPGRLNQMWFAADREGVYHGQCRELCGQRHAYMPITVRVVSDAQYAQWIDEAKKKYARTETGSKFASNAD
jgi:cytochrome c oxidase subunit 2